jgi:hypothetical protein
MACSGTNVPYILLKACFPATHICSSIRFLVLADLKSIEDYSFCARCISCIEHLRSHRRHVRRC